MCTSPIVVTYSPRLNKSDNVKIHAPYKHSILCQCGKCDECLKQYQNDWMVRIYSEMKRQHVAVFFTLTYNDDSVPEVFNEDTGERFTSVNIEEVARLLKNMREDLRKKGKKTDFKWFCTSEYGPTTLRAHYHGLILGLRLDDVRPYLMKWHKEKGYVQMREFLLADQKTALSSIRYVAKYCSKGAFENPYIQKGFIEPTSHLISKSIGNNYLNDKLLSYYRALDFHPKHNCDGSYNPLYLEEIRKRLNYPIPPCTYHLPRYYREVVFAKRKDLQVAYQDYICGQLLERDSPTLARISTDKPYRCLTEADHEAIRSEHRAVVNSIHQRKKDSRESVTKFIKNSKI